MKIEDQVTSRELSRELQELGVEVKGAFEWSRPSASMCLGVPEWSVVPSGSSPWLKINAYTVPELLGMLPCFVDGINIKLVSHSSKRQYRAEFYQEDSLIDEIKFDSSPSNALAMLLIWCLENGHVTAEEINERCGEES